MRKVVIIDENTGNELKDLLSMTQFKFKANIKKFLAALLEDPTGAEPGMIFTKNGLDKNKLIKSLVDNKVITKKMTIDDHDAEGNPHTARMIVKYSVPKERFNERLDALYDMLFPDAEGKINEETNEATGCSSVGGGGVFSGEGESYEYDYPAFAKKGKSRKNTKNVGGNPYTLNESQESKSIDTAKRLFMQRTGRSADEADKFVRVDLRNDLPVLRDKNGAKFILGVTRMFLDRQLTDASTIQNLNKTLKLLTQGHFNEYDRNLNGMSAQDLIQRFSTTMKQMDDRERDELSSMEFNGNQNYNIIRIDNFEQASQYGQYTSWCVTHYENMFDSYTSNGIGQFYFCLRNGFENEPAEPGEGCPLDSYGLSMVAVSVDENGRLNTCTCRWNHDNGGNDNIMSVKEISELIGQNFFEVFKPNGKWDEILENIKARLAAGEDLGDVFDYVSIFNDGLAVVELNSKYNWIRQDNGQFFSDQWFDLCGDFNEGLAWVELNSKYNWIRQDNGQFFSDQWFGACGDFHEGLAVVMLNNGEMNWVRADNGQLFSDQWYDSCGIFHEGLAAVRLDNDKCNWVRQDNGQLLSDQWFDKCYNFNEGVAVVKLNHKSNWVRADNGQLFSDQWYTYCTAFSDGFAVVELNFKKYQMRRDGVLCDYDTKEPIVQTENLSELVNRIIKRIITEAVTGEDADKAAAIYAYCLDDKEEDYCILCAKRIEGDEKGKWNPPMGHLHVGESPKDGAVRECEEESGVKIPKSKLQVGSYEDWGRNYWVILDGTIKDWPVGKGDGENSKFEWKNVYGLFYGKDKDLEWAWNTKDFIYKFAPAELDLD